MKNKLQKFTDCLWRAMIGLASHSFAAFLVGAALSASFAALLYGAIFNAPLSVGPIEAPQYIKFDFDICGKVLNTLSERQQVSADFSAQNLHDPFIDASATNLPLELQNPAEIIDQSQK